MAASRIAEGKGKEEDDGEKKEGGDSIVDQKGCVEGKALKELDEANWLAEDLVVALPDGTITRGALMYTHQFLDHMLPHRRHQGTEIRVKEETEMMRDFVDALVNHSDLSKEIDRHHEKAAYRDLQHLREDVKNPSITLTQLQRCYTSFVIVCITHNLLNQQYGHFIGKAGLSLSRREAEQVTEEMLAVLEKARPPAHSWLFRLLLKNVVSDAKKTADAVGDMIENKLVSALAQIADNLSSVRHHIELDGGVHLIEMTRARRTALIEHHRAIQGLSLELTLQLYEIVEALKKEAMSQLPGILEDVKAQVLAQVNGPLKQKWKDWLEKQREQYGTIVSISVFFAIFILLIFVAAAVKFLLQ